MHDEAMHRCIDSPSNIYNPLIAYPVCLQLLESCARGDNRRHSATEHLFERTKAPFQFTLCVGGPTRKFGEILRFCYFIKKLASPQLLRRAWVRVHDLREIAILRADDLIPQWRSEEHTTEL